MTWNELAKAAGAATDKEADFVLWSGTAFPFARVRTVWYQLRHVIRHKVCLDDPEARCGGRKPWTGA